jgi:putative ATP-dependent endonuclease of the OLD family
MPEGETLFDFDLEFTDTELADFKTDVGSSLKKSLPIRLSLGPKGAEFRVIKKGAGSPKLTEKRDSIARFLGSRLPPQYVPSVRTAQRSLRVVDEMVDRELKVLDASEDYQAAVASLAELQMPVLDALSETIRDMLSTFLPEVTGVQIGISEEDRFGALRRSSRMVVDDGTPTELGLKGDGVQSLPAIALIRHVRTGC